MLSKVLSRTLSRQPPTPTESDSKAEPKAEARRRSSSSSRHIPHGRGGAGNIGGPPPELSPEDLRTPTLKSDVYTTGRGGSGNMARNLDPEEARRAQDVYSHPRLESTSEVHVGRGGAANVVRLSDEELEAARREAEAWELAQAEEQKGGADAAGKGEVGLVGRGRKWLAGMKGNGAKEGKS